ncbi:malate dehydrogenase [Bordetella pertussis]|nr:malate dehydrogenase [Bordetella pertussis]
MRPPSGRWKMNCMAAALRERLRRICERSGAEYVLDAG